MASSKEKTLAAFREIQAQEANKVLFNEPASRDILLNRVHFLA